MITARDIYFTYLQGPAAIIKLLEPVIGRSALFGPPPPDQQERLIEEQRERIRKLEARIERLKEETSALRQRTLLLERRNRELEALLSRDSHNSSRPPSTDPAWAKRTKSLRRPSGRRAGGQVGHRGTTRHKAAHPDAVIEHRPKQCSHCHAPLSQGQILRHLRQQVWDVVPAKLKVTEHRLALLRCRACGRTTQGEFPEAVRSGVQYGPGVKARVLYLQQYQLLPYQRTSEAMRDLFGCQLSAGTVANIIKECAAGLVESELKIKQKLRRSSIIHADETGLRVAKQGYYIHVASTSRLTHYAADARRGRAAMDEIGILPKVRGTCVHDGWWSYDYYTSCRHSLCGAHILRELTFFEELNSEQKAWAAPLKDLLLEIKATVEQVREAGGEGLSTTDQAAFIQRYDKLVRDGLETNPPQASRAALNEEVSSGGEPPKGTPQKQARNLLLRMERKKDEVLRFMTDFCVPFDNNQAERDLRMVKLQQKVGGCFRSEEGARQFCRIRSYISTIRKQGRAVLQAFDRACRGAPLSPTRRTT